jgi:hypothetical protein
MPVALVESLVDLCIDGAWVFQGEECYEQTVNLCMNPNFECLRISPP